MKSLHTLLKIAKRDLEVLRRGLAEQNTRALLVEERMRTQEQTLRDEQQVARRDYEAGRAYGGFAMAAVATRRALEGEKELIEQESARLRVLIIEAHVEMRKFERLLELQRERERATLAKREDAELDEMATLRAGRQRK
jgi:hypothetical protein